MKRLDQHIHAKPLSSCSRMTQAEAAAFFLSNPGHIVTVSDHMHLEWYDRYVGPGKTFGAAETLYSIEVSMREPYIDLLLTTYDITAFDSLRPILAQGERFLAYPPMATINDPRVLTTWCHPNPEGPVPEWMYEIPLDFIEFNTTHLNLSWSRTKELAYVERLGSIFSTANFITGSDSHQSWTLGKTFVEFDEDMPTARAAWMALKEGQFLNHAEGWVFAPNAMFPTTSYPKAVAPTGSWQPWDDSIDGVEAEDLDAELEAFLADYAEDTAVSTRKRGSRRKKTVELAA